MSYAYVATLVDFFANKPPKQHRLHYDEMDFQSYLFVMTREARSIERHRHFMWHRVGELD